MNRHLHSQFYITTKYWSWNSPSQNTSLRTSLKLDSIWIYCILDSIDADDLVMQRGIRLQPHGFDLVCMEYFMSALEGLTYISQIGMTGNFLHIDSGMLVFHDDVIKWKNFPRYWPFVRGIHRSKVNSPHKGQWRRALMVSLICAWINAWVNNREAGDLRRHHAHYDVIVMWQWPVPSFDTDDGLVPVLCQAIPWACAN